MNWLKKLFKYESNICIKSATDLILNLRKQRKILIDIKFDSKQYLKQFDTIRDIEIQILNHPDEFLNPLNPFGILYMGKNYKYKQIK